MGQSVSTASVDWNYIAPPINNNENNNNSNSNNSNSNTNNIILNNDIIEEDNIENDSLLVEDYKQKKDNLKTLLKLLEHSINNSFYNTNFKNKNEIIIEQLDNTIDKIDQKKKKNESKFFSSKDLFVNNVNENKNIEESNVKLKIAALVLVLLAFFMKFAI